MARLLYVFPHPDDESFGPAAVMAAQRRAGHDVHLLTLTRGGATRQRHRLGLTVEQMGAVRAREMERMAAELALSSLEVLDFPDGGLADLDPLELEAAVAARLRALRPEVVVTYPVHGISGFPDHLVTHAVVKRVWCALRQERAAGLRRLAFFTLGEVPEGERPIRLSASPAEAIDCVVPAAAKDLEAQRRALAAYETYRETIAAMDPMEILGDRFCFELFGEHHHPPLEDLLAGL